MNRLSAPPSVNGATVRTSWRSRAWHAFRGWFRAELRAMTPAEADLLRENELLRERLERAEDRILDFQREVRILQDSVTIRDQSIEQLTEVIARDRKRVEAETAIAARKAAGPAPFDEEDLP